MMLQCVKSMKFTILISESPINVSCRFKLLIFEIALVIKHYLQFVFLVAHTVVFVVIFKLYH